MKQTAVEWLEQQLFNKRGKFNKSDIEQTKQMEKQQIIEAHEEGFYSPPFRMSRRKEAEQYYNETFKTK
jgi:hypothetical protein